MMEVFNKDKRRSYSQQKKQLHYSKADSTFYHHDADPDSTYHPYADPDVDPDSDFLLNADPDPDP
jgi:hypothetical protein